MRTKLLWMCMLYQRRLFSIAIQQGTCWLSHFSGDSSPQKPFDYMNMVEDRFIFDGSPQEVVRVFQEAGGMAKFCTWIRRTMPVTVLGAGCTSVSAKYYKFVHVLLLETGQRREHMY